MTKSTSLRNTFIHEIDTHFHGNGKISTPANELRRLPASVQRYFDFVNVSGTTGTFDAHILFGKTSHVNRPSYADAAIKLTE